LVVAVVLVLLVIVGVLWIGMPKGPALSEVAHLQTPEILEMGPQKVLLVRAQGNPNVVGKTAFRLLMKTYFGLKGVPKGGPAFKPPRARWPVDSGAPMEEWVGLYAIPIPETVTEVPDRASAGGLTVELTTWDYGEVAQVLHIGRYDQEPPTVEKLKAYVLSQEYEFSGQHEEEYLKGPGLLFAGNPDKYLTILRYPVRKVGR
jgi:hypothetical protein